MMTRLAIVALALGLSGCAGLDNQQQRVLTGGGAGAAGGALLGAIAGNAGLGAVLGAGVGAGAGFLYDHSKQNEANAYRQGAYDASRGRRY